MPRRHLIIRLAALGDLAMASSLARRIRDEEPDAELTWLCGSSGAELVRLFPEVDRVMAIDDTTLFRGNPVRRATVLAGAATRVAAGRYDRVYLLHADPRYALLAPAVRRGRITSLSREYGRMAPIPGRYFGDECARLYERVGHRGPIEGHFPLSDPRTRLPAVPAGGDATCDMVVLAPGGTRNVLRQDTLRRWPVASYRLLADALIREGWKVSIVGDRHDEWVRPAFVGLPVQDLVGELTLPETLGLMRDAALVVTHDTGPMHMARLVRAPLVAIFGPTRPAERLVEDERTVAIWGGEDLACRPCYDGREFARCDANICISRVEVPRVLDAARTLLATIQRPTEGLQPART